MLLLSFLEQSADCQAKHGKEDLIVYLHYIWVYKVGNIVTFPYLWYYIMFLLWIGQIPGFCNT